MVFEVPPTLRRCPTGLRVGGVLVGVAVVAAATAWVCWGGERPALHAQGGLGDDTDGDGLPDGLELVLGTQAASVDSDGDGWGDGEEVARHSSPLLATSIPSAASSNSISVATDAFLTEGDVHAVTAVYLPGGRTVGHRIQYFTIHNGGIAPVPWSAMMGGVGLRTVLTRGGQGAIVVLDPIINEQRVLLDQGFSLCAVVSKGGQRLAADAINLTLLGGEIVEHVTLDGPSLVQAPPSFTGLGVGGVYRPIGTSSTGNGGSGGGGSGGGSSNYTIGEICAQTTVVVGVVGALVTQEVIAADCVGGWDAHCSTGCSATVGSTIKTIDPAALIGG